MRRPESDSSQYFFEMKKLSSSHCSRNHDVEEI